MKFLQFYENLEKSWNNSGYRFINFVSFIGSILLFLGGIYVQIFHSRIFSNDNLIEIHIVLYDSPQYEFYTVKGTKYRRIKLGAKGYDKPFVITNSTYDFVNHTELINCAAMGDEVSVYMSEEDAKNVRNKNATPWYNEIFNVKCKGEFLVDGDKRNNYQANQNNLFTIIAIPFSIIVFFSSFSNYRKWKKRYSVISERKKKF